MWLLLQSFTRISVESLRSCRIGLIAGLVVCCSTFAAPPAKAADKVEYNRDIRPILSNYCFSCHGPAEGSREADLRLDQREAALENGSIEPGDPEGSEMIRRILSEDQDEVMPPRESNKPLTAEQKKLLIRWVKQGAEYQVHWSFIAPVKPKLPKISDPDWVKNPIDQFVLARLDSDGIKPSKQAGRASLIRRVCFDVTGLPPTMEEIKRFLGSKEANWYEQMVDHYLAQAAYGERMALAWMDAARYGDTSVFHADGPRDMWPWRDWIINFYNQGRPFDEFTVEQLAGDLIPNATPYQKIASGFNRNHASTDEGGAIAEEWRIDYVVDRVQTTSNVWLGISMECGQCHSHKFDPISQKEYYGFFAFFNQTTDPGMQTRNGNQTPVVNVPDAQRDSQITELSQRITKVDSSLKENEKQAGPIFQTWLKEESEKIRSGKGPQPPADMLAHFQLDETDGKQISDAIADRKGTVKGKASWTTGKFAGGFQLDGSNYIELGDLANFEQNEAISYGCWIKPEGAGSGSPLAKMDDDNAHRGWDFLLSGGNVAVHIINTWPGNAIKVTTKQKIAADQWTHLFATYDGSGKAKGVKIYFNGKLQPWNQNNDSLNGTIKSAVSLKIGRRHKSGQFKGIVDDVRIYNRALSDLEIGLLAGSDPLTPLLVMEPDKRTPEQMKTLRDHYLSTINKKHKQLAAEKKTLTAKADLLKKEIVTCMIMGEQEKPRETYLLMRGHYASPDKSEVIKPAVPKVFPPLAQSAPRNRLGLAQWLVSDEHPLTARVAVNRYWTMLFGRGIVATPLDFGSQGAWPSHLELLDWLAVDFRDHGWDVKRTLKLLLMSATYRQSSRMSDQLSEKDPQNILLARGTYLRLQGEMIRDSALAVSGLLVDQIGGPGVKPYQPPGLWNEVSLSGNVRFVADKQDKLYRKSMYIYWKRSSPHPGMRVFDAPTREKCVVQRARTNTPLQALYTLNDTQFVEAARALAGKIIRQGGSTPQEKIRYAYQLTTSHLPSDKAVTALVNLFQSQQSKYEKNESQANELLAIGDSPVDKTIPVAELAAWTVLANVLLNMDATLTR